VNSLQTFFTGKLKGIENAGSVSEGIERVAKLFPEPQVQARISQNLRVMADYEWELPREREKALEHVETMFCSLDIGHPRQACLHYLEAEDRMFFDYSNKAIRLAKSAGLKLKPLAKLNQMPAKSFEIRGPRHSWRFRPLDSYDRTVPTKVLMLAKAIQDLGLKWHMSFVGEPHFLQMYAYARPYKDPILAISIGRWILEVARWE
jgi:hypothetical protein